MAIFFEGPRLVDEMIKHYTDSQNYSDCKGYLLLMCNAIWFSAEQRPDDDLLRQLLDSNLEWNQFLPLLR